MQIPSERQLDLAVEVPASELGPVASNEMWEEIYKRIARAGLPTSLNAGIRQHAGALPSASRIICGECWATKPWLRITEACRGKVRLAVETKLKAGGACARWSRRHRSNWESISAACDLVCQVGSPRSISVFLQRVGRAGHWRGAMPKGRIFATTRDELLECAALVRVGAARRTRPQSQIPEAPLDVLAQQIVAACAAEDWSEDELFALVRRAYPYRESRSL